MRLLLGVDVDPDKELVGRWRLPEKRGELTLEIRCLSDVLAEFAGGGTG